MSHHLHDKKITRCVRIFPSTFNVRIVTGATGRVEHVYNKTLDTCSEPRLARDDEEEEKGREKRPRILILWVLNNTLNQSLKSA